MAMYITNEIYKIDLWIVRFLKSVVFIISPESLKNSYSNLNRLALE